MNPDLEPIDDGRPARKARKNRDLGKLHALLIRGLPDWIDGDGLLLVRDIAKYIGVSAQAAYKWLERESLLPKRVNALVKLSEGSKKPFQIDPATGEPYGPLTKADFYEFL